MITPRELLGFWRRRRFHPVTRIGWRMFEGGSLIGDQPRSFLGLGLVATGFYLKRRGQRTLLYTGQVAPGESVQIRLVDRGRILDEVEVRG